MQAKIGKTFSIFVHHANLGQWIAARVSGLHEIYDMCAVHKQEGKNFTIVVGFRVMPTLLYVSHFVRFSISVTLV